MATREGGTAVVAARAGQRDVARRDGAGRAAAGQHDAWCVRRGDEGHCPARGPAEVTRGEHGKRSLEAGNVQAVAGAAWVA